jgi:hypothetical protein
MRVKDQYGGKCVNDINHLIKCVMLPDIIWSNFIM